MRVTVVCATGLHVRVLGRQVWVYIRVRDRNLVVQCLLDVPLSIKSSDFCIYIIYMM